MSIAAQVREKLISSFRAELAEHIQTMTDGLLALEQGHVAEEQCQVTLEEVFRAAHSLKGAARAVGVTMIEQLAHALEDLLDAMRHDPSTPRRARDDAGSGQSSGHRAMELSPELFSACYGALDAIQEVQAAYESGEITPPARALQALANLEPFRRRAMSKEVGSQGGKGAGRQRDKGTRGQKAESVEPDVSRPDPQPPTLRAEPPRPELGTKAQGEASNLRSPFSNNLQAPTSDETIRVSVSKLDALMAQLSELLVTKIRAEQRLTEMRELQESLALWQKEWLSVRSAYGQLVRHDISGILGLRRPEPVEGRRPEPVEGRRPEPVEGRRPEPFDYAQDALVEGRRSEFAEEWKGGVAGPWTGGDGRSRLGKEMLRLLDYVGVSQERLREMNGLVNSLVRQYAEDTMQISLVIDELEQEIKRVRMLPLSTITNPFGRMVRDLAREAGKEAVLQVVGGETELDKRVLEQIKDPLIHLLRNAIDHGIEPAEEREASGKRRGGTVTLTAEQLGKDVVICVSDDGAGLDMGAIRQAVGRRGIDVQGLSEAELAEIIFKPGISTSPIITDISGRGVGLDVVRRNVEALYGRIDVDWTPGAGAAFTLTLPLRLTSSHGLLVRVSRQLFAIPLNAIERILQISPRGILPLEGQDTIRYNGRSLTLVRLDDVLELPRVEVEGEGVVSFSTAERMHLSKGEARILVVILGAAERRMAFVVDELAGEQEMVIKGMGQQLRRVGGIAGATVMGSGEVVLILNVADLIKLAIRGKRRSVFDARWEGNLSGGVRAQRRILVVDDSITTRTLEKNILEAAGYTVQLAMDGQEALSAIVTGGVPDLIVSDIVMPRMDGFELTRRIKGDPSMAEVPVILVTSLGSAGDKARGIEVGADAYIVKSSFDQDNLLETIEQLI